MAESRPRLLKSLWMHGISGPRGPHHPVIVKGVSSGGEGWFVDFQPTDLRSRRDTMAHFATFEEAVAWLVENDPRKEAT